MVRLDLRLIQAARRHITGANVHRVKEMIFAYEQAVDLHNRKSRGYEHYRIGPELRLRNFVMEQQAEEIHRRTADAIDRAEQARKKSSS
jgi:hypothetical protein